MRIGWLLLFFPSFAFALMGCPVGVQLGNVTMATPLPVCLKFEGSELGGCKVDCKGVCVELPLNNTKGPVETTGTACKLSDNGSGNGDSDGSGNTPDEGGAGTKPINGWLDFEPVIGDATGTSASGAVAKLNKNLGVALRQVVDSANRDSNNINSITHSAESIARDMKDNLSYLDRIANDVFSDKTNTHYLLEKANITNGHLEAMVSKLGNPASGSSGTSGSGSSGVDPNRLFGTLDAMRYGSLNNIDWKLGNIVSHVSSIEGSLGSNGMSGNIYAMRQMMEKMTSGGGSDGGSGSGASIDYSKMPGSADNPLSVGGSNYKSACSGDSCFFDVASTQKKLDDAKKSLSDKQSDISKEVQDIFAFQLSGSAGAIDCFDLFSHNGKNYQVCPPSKEYWATLAAMMMFIFYFIALLVIFRR